MNCSRYWRTVSRVSAHVTVALYFSPACVTLAQVWYEFLSFSVQFTRSNFVVTCFTLIVTTFVSAWFSTCYTVLFSVDREKSFDSPRVRRFEEQTAQIENSENFPSAESLSTTARWLSWGLSFRRELTLSKQLSVSHAWKSHGVDMQGDACWRYCTTFVRCNVGGACGFWLGWRFVWKGRARQWWSWEEANICCDTCHVCSYEAEKLSKYFVVFREACTSLGIQSHCQDWMTQVPIQFYSGMSVARSVVWEDVETVDVSDVCSHVTCGCRIGCRLASWSLDAVAGEGNPADTFTKALLGHKICGFSEHAGQRWLLQSQQQQQQPIMENIGKDTWQSTFLMDWPIAAQFSATMDGPGSLGNFWAVAAAAELV